MRRSTSRAACDMLWLAAGSATRMGGPPLAAASGSVEVPPVSDTTGDPVRPWKSMPTAVSSRTGVRAIDGNGRQHLPRVGGC